jgi:hypothetical protein
MSELKVNSIVDSSGGSTVKINGFTPTVSNMSGRNRIINGEMRIDQRNAGASVSPGTSGGIEYSVDRFGGARPGSGVAFTLQQIADAPAGFVNSLRATVPTGATPSGTQLSFVAQPIEGLNVSDFGWGGANAQTITLSFWVKSSVTGSFPLVLVNSGNSRAYGATYTISAANTWEQKTVVVPGDTSGTWLTTNGVGIQVNWGLGGAGASRTVTTGWQTPSSPGSSVGVIAGTVNLVATTGATWQVTGVQLEAGSVATPFERRPYGTELAMCQRYFEKSFMQDTAPANGASSTALLTETNTTRGYSSGSTTLDGFLVPYKVTKRANPTLTLFGNSSGQWLTTGNANAGATITAGGDNGYAAYQTLTGAVSPMRGHWTASAEL